MRAKHAHQARKNASGVGRLGRTCLIRSYRFVRHCWSILGEKFCQCRRFLSHFNDADAGGGGGTISAQKLRYCQKSPPPPPAPPHPPLFPLRCPVRIPAGWVLPSRHAAREVAVAFGSNRKIATSDRRSVAPLCSQRRERLLFESRKLNRVPERVSIMRFQSVEKREIFTPRQRERVHA